MTPAEISAVQAGCLKAMRLADQVRAKALACYGEVLSASPDATLNELANLAQFAVLLNEQAAALVVLADAAAGSAA